MARFFIDRPVFAWVIAILIMGIGILSVLALPVAQYPEIAPPSVSVSATYPGASAETVENTVTQIIEQQMTGLDGMRYMSSSSTSAGTVSITLTFEAGVTAVPVSAFYQSEESEAPRNFIRLCFSKRDTMIDEALERLARWIERRGEPPET